MADRSSPAPLPSPLEEAVLCWLTGAALASGATRLSFFVDPPSRRLTVVDDGAGLPPAGFTRCHGFRPSPGKRPPLPEGPARTMGAALRPALLLARAARVETRREGSRAVRFELGRGGAVGVRPLKPRGLVRYPSGTAVTLLFPDRYSALLDPGFVAGRLLKNFSAVMAEVPADGKVAVLVDGKVVAPDPAPADAAPAGPAGAGLAGRLNSALADLIPDYPELAEAVGARLPEVPAPRETGEKADIFDSSDPFGGQSPAPAPAVVPVPEVPPCVTVEWEDDPLREPPARMDGTTLIMNRLHPAWEAAEKAGALEYHSAVCLALALSMQLDPGRDTASFVSNLLSRWSSAIS